MCWMVSSSFDVFAVVGGLMVSVGLSLVSLSVGPRAMISVSRSVIRTSVHPFSGCWLVFLLALSRGFLHEWLSGRSKTRIPYRCDLCVRRSSM